MSSSEVSGMRAIDVPNGDLSALAGAIDAMYDNTLDVLVVRGALPREPLEAAVASLQTG